MSGFTKGVLSFGTAGILTVAFYFLDSEIRQPQNPGHAAEQPAPATVTFEIRACINRKICVPFVERVSFPDYGSSTAIW